MKNTADINTFKVDFQFMQYAFKFEVDNTKLLQELMGLLNLVCSFEIDLFLLQSNQLLQKDESVLSIQMQILKKCFLIYWKHFNNSF